MTRLTLKQYDVYAKPLQNNIGDEPERVSTVIAFNKRDAIFIAMTDPSNTGMYAPASFFAVPSN